MKCYEITNGTVVAGFPLVKDDSGRFFVLVGTTMVSRSIGGAQSYTDGEKVFLTHALASTLAPGEDRLMEAVLIKDADGKFLLDVSTSGDGVLIRYAIETDPYRRYDIGLPSDPERESVVHISVASGMYYFHYYPFVLAPLFAGETIAVSTVRERHIVGTGPRWLNPFEKKKYENFNQPFETVSFDGELITCKKHSKEQATTQKAA
jgi:hypothetical protein